MQAKTDAVYFDVGLGNGNITPVNEPPEYVRMWKFNTQRRADALLVRGNELWLTEIRFAANPNAIGRLLAYRYLWEKDPVLPGKLQLVLVTNIHDEVTGELAEKSGIQYEVT